jgi:hypothetical protein
VQPEQGPENIKLAVNKMFTFALVWGLGGNLVHTKHSEFDQFVRGVIGKVCQIPSMGSVYDICVDFSSSLVELRSWSDFVPSFAYDKTVSFHSMLVPTADTCRCAITITHHHSLPYTLLFHSLPDVLRAACRAASGLHDIAFWMLSSDPEL